MAKTFDEVVYSLCKKYTDQSQLGFKSVKQVANGFEIEYVNGIKATYTVQNMHKHTNMSILNVLNKDADGDLTFNGKKITNLTADQEELLMKFSLSANNKLLFDGKEITPDFIVTTGAGKKFLADDGTYKTISGGGAGIPYDDTEVRGLIDTNKTNIATNTSDISDLTTKIGTETMGTTATTIKGAVKEINGNQLDTVSFSSDYKNIVLNRKNGLNPYSIPIAAIINHAKLIELGDVDTADIGDGKTLMYDAATQKHKYVSSAGTDELVKMDNTSDAKYLVNLLDKQTVVNDNGVLKVKKLDGQEVTIAEINYLKGLTMNVMDLVNTFANGGVKVINTPVATAADLVTLDRSKFIDGISYIVYVLADESHAGAKTTYLCDKTNTTFFGNADSQRNFTTNPINLANEVTGKLGTSNIDVDNLWKLLTIDDTYKTLTTKDEVFGTHGAKALYDELTTAIGGKANANDLTIHTDNTGIHVTTADKTKWNKVTDKIDKTDFNTHKNDTNIHITSSERTKWNGKEDSSNKTTTISSTSTDTQYPTAKAVYNSMKNKNTIQPTGTITNYSTIFDWAINNVGATCGYEGNMFDDCPLPNTWGTLVCIGTKVESGLKVLFCTNFNKDIYTRTIQRRNGVNDWVTSWQRVCTTNVEDVPFTKLTLDSSVFDTTKYSDANISYIVRNGVCTITCKGVGLVSAGTYVVASNIPNPVGGYATNILQVQSSVIVPTKPVFLTVYNTELSIFSEGNTGPFWGTLTYTVAES